MRLFQVGDIVRDRPLDEMLPEHQRHRALFRVAAASHSTEWDPVPKCIRVGDALVPQQYLTLEPAEGRGLLRCRVAQAAISPAGPLYEVVKSVEESVAEELMR